MRTRILSSLHAIIALNAIGGGLFGLTGAHGVPVEWLRRTPFPSDVVPSLILLVVVGGAHSLAAIHVGRRRAHARIVSLAAGAILLGWISVQVALIGYVSWLQPAVALAALVNLALGAGRFDRGRATA